MTDDLADRAAAALRRLTAQYGMRVRLAKELNVVPSAITPYVEGDREVTLRMLQAVSKLTGERVSEMLAPPNSSLKELDPEEAAILRWLRSWPRDVTRNLAAFLMFFADEPPALQRDRSFHDLYRNLGDKDRELIYSIALQAREQNVSPDMRAALVRRLEEDATQLRAREARRLLRRQGSKRRR